jgi:hypothetical protein
VLWALGPGLWAQSAPPIAHSPQPTAARPRVYLITVGQGAAVWEKFGHNALWFFDDAGGVDEAYNWGVFDFEQPGFLRRFLTGDTKYWVERYPGQLLIDYYKRTDRTVVVQRLNFTPAQAQRALAYARWNALDENKFYRYDYFRDNCSTRVRDLIDYALGGTLKKATMSIRGPGTYRTESVRLVNDLKLTQFGIYTALGHPADKRLSLWEMMFIPMRLRDVIRGQRIGDVGAGGGAPLVAEERVLYESRSHHERTDAPKLWLPYLIVGLLFGAEFVAVGSVRGRSTFADKLFRMEVAIWALVTGILGLVLLLAWTTTRHVFWYGNENLLLLNPIALFLAATVLLSMRQSRFGRPALITATVIAGLSVLSLLLKPIPLFTQDNLALVLLFIPPHVAIAIGLRRGVPVPTEHGVVDRR